MSSPINHSDKYGDFFNSAPVGSSNHKSFGSKLGPELNNLIKQGANPAAASSSGTEHTSGLGTLMTAVDKEGAAVVKRRVGAAARLCQETSRLQRRSTLKQPGTGSSLARGASVRFDRMEDVQEFNEDEPPVEVARAQSDISAGRSSIRGKSEPVEVSGPQAKQAAEGGMNKLKASIKNFFASIRKAFAGKIKDGSIPKSMHGMDVSKMSIEEIERELDRTSSFDKSELMGMTQDDLTMIEELLTDMLSEVNDRARTTTSMPAVMKLNHLAATLQSAAEDIDKIGMAKANAVASQMGGTSSVARRIL